MTVSELRKYKKRVKAMDDCAIAVEIEFIGSGELAREPQMRNILTGEVARRLRQLHAVRKAMSV